MDYHQRQHLNHKRLQALSEEIITIRKDLQANLPQDEHGKSVAYHLVSALCRDEELEAVEDVSTVISSFHCL